ncbi:AAA family ATPase [Streptomyces sp. NPDC006638]|uniref:AAA family ATPase n=1 Tax=Streptomyces sp. NPDC006638 TaxID=3157183 RepID=UPI00339E827C
MSWGQASRTRQRQLIEIAVSERGDAAFGEAIGAQVAAVERWWADALLDEERCFTVAKAEKLQDVYDLRVFLDQQRPEKAEHDTALVVYVTGHGVSRPSGEHFLLLPASNEDRLPATAFQTADLIMRVLDSEADHVLIMVDSCYSGVLRKELLRRCEALSGTRQQLNSLVVISSANSTGTPHPEQFTRFIEEVRAHFEKEEFGFADPHLSFADFFGAMSALYKRGVSANVQRIWPEEDSLQRDEDHQQPSPCLPNPGYHHEPALVSRARSALAWSADDFSTSWLAHSEGPAPALDATRHFTGRTDLVRRTIEFLAGEEGALVVTGEAGSGKSALLARTVTLSDPAFRTDERYGPLVESVPPDLLPPEGAVDAAVLARDTDADELAAALYAALTDEPTPEGGGGSGGRGISSLDHLLDHVLVATRQRRRPLVLVIDGIDEARDPVRIITDLIRPLADQGTDDGQPAVRMLLGVRSARAGIDGLLTAPRDRASDLLSLLVRSTGAGEPLRTDTASTGEIAAYAGTRLRMLFEDPGSLARPDPHRLDELASVVAQEVTPSFLDARLAVEALHARARLPEPGDAEWRRTLRLGTRELLRQDLLALQRHADLPAEELVQVLRATAFGLGSGLPWADVWPCAVRALSGGAVASPETVVRRVHGSGLAGFLVKGVEDGRFVYRPTHERISEVLRENPQALLGDGETLSTPEASSTVVKEAHRRLAVAFGALQEEQDGAPHPYVRHHLVRHAAAGGVLNDLVVTEGFLPYETSGNVRGAVGLLSEHVPDTTRLFAWMRIEPFLADAPPPARAESLRFSQWDPETGTYENAHAARAAAARPAAARLVTRWKELSVPGNVLAREDTEVCSLISFTLPDGTPVIAVGAADGGVRVWDPTTVTPVGPAIPGDGFFAQALAVVRSPGGDVLLAVGCASGVWMCDPLSGRKSQLPVTAAVHALQSFSDEDGAIRLAIGTSEGLVVCDPLTGVILKDEGAGGGAQAVPVLGLATVARPGDGGDAGDVVLLAVQRADSVEILEGASLGQVCAVPVSGEQISALTLFNGRERGPVLALAAHTSGTIRFWDALTGAEHRHRAIRQSAAVLAPYHRPGSDTLLAVGTDTGAVHLWNPETGEEEFRFPPDHTGVVTGLAVVLGPDEVPVLVSGALDRTVRIWNPVAWTSRTGRSSPSVDGTLMAVLPGAPGSPELVSVGPDRNLLLRSAGTGLVTRSIPFPQTGVDGAVTALATYAVPGGPAMIFVGLPDGTIGRWDGDDWLLMNAWTSEEDHATAFAAFADGARTVLVAGTSRGSLVYCDPATGEVLDWLHGDGDARSAVRAVVHLPLLSGSVLAVASGRGLRTCRPFREPDGQWAEEFASVECLAVCVRDDAEGEWLLAAGGADGGIRVWTPDRPEEKPFTLPVGHDGPVSALGVVRPPGSRPLLVSTGLKDTTMRLWDFATGEEVLRLVTAASLTSLSIPPPRGGSADRQPVIVIGGRAGIAAVALNPARSEESS